MQPLSAPVPEHAILNKLNVRYVPESNDESMQIKPLQKCFAALLLTFYNIIHNVTLELKALVIFTFQMLYYFSSSYLFENGFTPWKKKKFNHFIWFV